MTPSQKALLPKTTFQQIAKSTFRVVQILSVILVLGSIESVKANTIIATNTTLGAVQTAVNSANFGDTVNIPAGTATWTGTLSITNDIQVIGAGVGQTVIYDNEPRTGGNNGNVIYWSTVGNGFCRLSGISFSYLNTSQAYSGCVGVGGLCHAFRLDHCNFTNIYNDELEFGGGVLGCIDHCIFYSTLNTGEPINNQMPNYGGANYSWGDGSWGMPDSWGTTNALYIENNIFVGGSDVGNDAYDGYQGARVVFRYNTLTNIVFGSHGTESGQRERSLRSFEVYNNNFFWTTNGGSLSPWAIYIRGGTGVAFSNTVAGGIEYLMVMAAYRSGTGAWPPWGPASGACPWDSNSPTILAQGTALGASGSMFLLDTTMSWTPNAWVNDFIWDTNQNLASYITGNTATEITYPGGQYGVSLLFNMLDHYEVRKIYQVLDQPGVGQGDLVMDTSPGSGVPIDSVTGKANWPNEAIDPIYDWGNTLTLLEPNNPTADNGVAETPTIISGYNWADFTQRPGYTPLAYPHPLDGGTNSVSPPPTFTLTVINGSGSGSYASNTVVSISANQTTNQSFLYWSGPDIANTNLANTTVTMPGANITVTAVYVPNPGGPIQYHQVP